MKVLIVTGIFPPDIGGPASYVPKIANEFINRGHEVEVICLSDSLEHKDQYPYLVKRIKRALFKPFRWIKAISLIRKSAQKSDIVYVNGLPFETTIALLFKPIPTVQKIVGDYSWERARNRNWFKGTIDEYQNAKKSILLKATDWIRTFPLTKTQKIIVPSNYLKGIVKGWGIREDKVKVIYNAVEIKRNSSNKALSAFEGKTMITVCRLVPWKGLTDLIEVTAEISDVRLVIAGDGPLREELEDLAKNLGLGKRIIFLGHVAKEDVFNYLEQSDCFILNSTYEGLPHVVLEAMGVGIPVIATNVGGTGEVVSNGETGILIPPGDRNFLKKAVKKVLTDKDFSNSICEKSKLILESKFTYENMITETEKILIYTAEKYAEKKGKAY